MRHAEFNKLLSVVHARMIALTQSKGEEYKGAEDNQFGNFERTAQDTGLSREQVWLVFFNKHFDALRTYVRDKATGTERQRSESITGRIDDAILYLILLRGMVGQNETTASIPTAAHPCPRCREAVIFNALAPTGSISNCRGCGVSVTRFFEHGQEARVRLSSEVASNGC